MIANNDFPWYLQQSSVFLALYTGFFDVAVMASPLGMGDMFNIDEASGRQLFRIGTYFGMAGSPTLWDGLIYDVDNWSDVKTWTGGVKEIAEDFYRKLVKAKAYAYGRPYSLTTLKGVLDRIFDQNGFTTIVTEDYMEITISISGPQNEIEMFVEAKAFDVAFIGKPVGIKVNWEYNYE